jgi:hypothetical protein
MGPTRQQLIAIKNQSGVGEGDPPLWKQYGMTDLIANAIVDRDSLAYYDVFSMVYGVDEFRRAKYGELGWLALIEGSGTQLGPPGGDITASPTIGGNSVLTDLGNGEYRAYLPDGSGTFFYFYDGAVISGDHTICFEWRKTPGSVETGTLTVQGQDASNAGPLYLLDATPPDEWTKVCVTESEPGTSTYLAFFDTGGVDFQIRLAQFEQNPYPTSWIPGPGTARAADDVETSVITQSKGLLLLPFKRPYALTGSEQFRLYEASGGATDLLVNVSSAGTISTQIEGVGVGSTPAITVTDWNIYGYAWDNGAARVFLNGTKEVSASASDPIGSVFALLYGGPFSANRYLNGVGGALQREGYSFTDDQITAISDDLLARLPA